ncbi:unnamed protein product [Notodromas monacha]|uniref:Uncharacterized protein n=1 Tax=Notodromas monacha TaxID=399045 RepID=A0A7R9GDB6_9CRUS|nr:unnamed protein product [Notodromas monacha]CAG0916759.1 unnamed protein product [Notodromas monacha]
MDFGPTNNSATTSRPNTTTETPKFTGTPEAWAAIVFCYVTYFVTMAYIVGPLKPVFRCIWHRYRTK